MFQNGPRIEAAHESSTLKSNGRKVKRKQDEQVRKEKDKLKGEKLREEMELREKEKRQYKEVRDREKRSNGSSE